MKLRRSRLLSLFVPGLAFLGASAAHADTVFTFVNTYVHDSANHVPITGTITVDTVTGTITHTDFTIGAGDGFQSKHFLDASTHVGSNGPEPTEARFGLGPVLYLDFPNTVANLIGYQGGDVCSEALDPGGSCTFYSTPSHSETYASTYAVTSYGSNETLALFSGSLADLSALPVGGTGREPNATPEPSGLALLGTGVVGVFGAARRRLRR